jgi:hypothetical protein
MPEFKTELMKDGDTVRTTVTVLMRPGDKGDES